MPARLIAAPMQRNAPSPSGVGAALGSGADPIWEAPAVKRVWDLKDVTPHQERQIGLALNDLISALDDNDEGVKADYKVGDVVKVDIFAPGEIVKVTGTTKGRGFQGVVKRHGFGGGPNTHGNTRHRKPGSIGPGTDPSRVIKGKKMPGHYGAERHTQINLRVEKIDAERNLIYIRGSVAGPTNGIVLVRKQG